MNATTLAVFGLGGPELLIIGIVGVLLFGRRLPEVGKSFGRTIVEFKKGLNATTEELNKASQEEEEKKPRAKLPGKDPQQVKRIASGGEEP